MVPLETNADFIRDVLAHFAPRIPEAADFARRSRVILVWASNGCAVDISLGLPGYEESMMKRVVDCEIAPGRVVRVCSAEDLIIHKAIAGRGRDIQDIEGIVFRQGERLDVAYIRKWLSEFAALLEEPEVLERFERPWRRLTGGQVQ